MDVATLFFHNMGKDSPGYAVANYSKEITQTEIEKIKLIMAEIKVKEKMFPGFNTWIFMKNGPGSKSDFSVKRFTWDHFEINGSLDEIKKMIIA